MGRRLLAAAATLVAASMPTTSASAHIFGDMKSLPAYLFATAPVYSPGQGSLGFTFTVTKNTTVTGLAYWDDGGNGFSTDHPVAIFAEDGFGDPGVLVTSTVLAAGKSGELVNAFPYGSSAMYPSGFRYQKINPIILGSGLYTIAGLSPDPTANDPVVYGGPAEIANLGPIGFGFQPPPPAIVISPDAARYTDGTPGLEDPISHVGDYQIYAVNFSGYVPEPSTWAMMLVGLVALGAALRTRRRTNLTAAIS